MRLNVIFSTEPQYIREPLLEFGGGHRHQDVRFGLMDFGPVDFDPDRPRTIRIGVIGNSATTDGFCEWLHRCDSGIPAKNSRQPNLFPAFPGTRQNGPFRCRFEIEDRVTRVITSSSIATIVAEPRDDLAIERALSLFAAEIKGLSETENPPNVIICALPVELIERVKNMRVLEDEEADEEERPEDEKSEEEDNKVRDFRGALRAHPRSLDS